MYIYIYIVMHSIVKKYLKYIVYIYICNRLHYVIYYLITISANLLKII